jgi:flavin reductase (DIM6/NTAB) family NADH-FMN oxidoreductase RutF
MRKEIDISSVFEETVEYLKGDGVILLAGNPPNPMTIGWGTIGYIWGRLIFTVLVRPSRFTFSLMESSTEFTVNLLPDEFIRQLSLCGTKSGRNTDKLIECGFQIEKGINLVSPYIRESAVHFECCIVHKHDLIPENLDINIAKRYYPSDDFHKVYYGEILGVFREMPVPAF